MKKLIIALSLMAMACTKDNKVDVQPILAKKMPIPLDSLNGSKVSLRQSNTITYAYSAQGNPAFTLDFSGAVVGSTITLITPANNMYGFEVRSVDAYFNKANATADYSIKRSSTQITIVYRYLGIVGGKPSVEWYDIQK